MRKRNENFPEKFSWNAGAQICEGDRESDAYGGPHAKRELPAPELGIATDPARVAAGWEESPRR
jgi:hypothetical protein